MLRGMALHNEGLTCLVTSNFANVVQALYYDRTYLKHLLHVLFAVEQIIMAVLFGVSMPHMNLTVCTMSSQASLVSRQPFCALCSYS